MAKTKVTPNITTEFKTLSELKTEFKVWRTEWLKMRSVKCLHQPGIEEPDQILFSFFFNPDLLLKVKKPSCSLKTALNANQSSELIGMMKNYKRYPFS